MGRVLIVEDNPTQAALLAGLLPEYNTTTVRTLRDAVEESRIRPPFDAVILDLGLPDAEGTEAVEVVARACPRAAIVVYTGEDPDEVLEDCLGAGADEVIGKTSRAHVVKHALLVGIAARARTHRRGVVAVRTLAHTLAPMLGVTDSALG